MNNTSQNMKVPASKSAMTISVNVSHSKWIGNSITGTITYEKQRVTTTRTTRYKTTVYNVNINNAKNFLVSADKTVD